MAGVTLSSRAGLPTTTKKSAMDSVSFVVTVYNKQPFLRRVVEALRAQVGPFESEFIFVDDGSTDDSGGVLRDLVGPLANATIITQPNKGPSAALNAGLAIARGTFIKPVDGDDVLSPWASLDLIRAIRQSGGKVAAARVGLQASYPFVDDGRVLFGNAAAAIAHGDVDVDVVSIEEGLAASIRRPTMTPTAMMFTRAALEETGGCDPDVFVQDYSLELRLVSRYPVAWIDSECYASPDEAPGRLSINVLQTLHDVNYALQRFLAATPELPPALVAAAIRRATGRAWHYARRNHNETVLSSSFTRFLAARYTHAGRNPALIAQTCAAFRAAGPIRFGARDVDEINAPNLVHLDAARRRIAATGRAAGHG